MQPAWVEFRKGHSATCLPCDEVHFECTCLPVAAILLKLLTSAAFDRAHDCEGGADEQRSGAKPLQSGNAPASGAVLRPTP